MATATQSLGKEIQGRPASVTLAIEIPKNMLPDLGTMFQAASRGEATARVEVYLGEIVAAAIAEFRALRIRPDLSFVDSLDEKAEAAEQSDESSTTHLSPQDCQRIIHLRFSEGLSVRDIATRLSRGRSTIRRICDAYERREHHDFNIQVSGNSGVNWEERVQRVELSIQGK